MAKRISQAVLVEALTKAGGVPAGAAQILGCARSTVTRRVNADEKLKALCSELQDELLDIAEYNVAAAVRNTKHRFHFAACKFILETKGKKRGWSKQLDLNVVDPVPIIFSPSQAQLG